MATAPGQDAGQAAGENNDGGDAGAAESTFETITTQEALDRIVQSRLARERAKFADYADLKGKAAEFDKLQEAAKSDLQKVTDRATRAEAERASEKLTAMRYEVALEKGLTAVQAKRLVGTTKDELAADADELVASFKPEGETGTRPSGLPKERLRGGGDPTEEVDETDPRKLAERVRIW